MFDDMITSQEKTNENIHVVRIPFSREQLGFFTWVIFNVCVSVGIWYISFHYNAFGYTCIYNRYESPVVCGNFFFYLLIFVLFISMKLMLSYLGVLGYIKDHIKYTIPKFRFVWKNE